MAKWETPTVSSNADRLFRYLLAQFSVWITASTFTLVALGFGAVCRGDHEWAGGSGMEGYGVAEREKRRKG